MKKIVANIQVSLNEKKNGVARIANKLGCLLLIHYFCVLSRLEVLFQYVLPMILCSPLVLILLKKNELPFLAEIKIFLLLFMLLYVVTMITFIIMSNSQNKHLEAAREKMSSITVVKHQASLYQVAHISFTYALFIQLTALIITAFSLILLAAQYNQCASYLFIVSLYLFFHCIIVSLNNLYKLYAIYFK